MSAAHAATAIAALLTVLAFAAVRPGGLPEAVVAVPAAAAVVLAGAVSPDRALAELRGLGPTVGFLAAVLLLAHLAGAEGLFAAAGEVMARRCHGRPVRLLRWVFGLGAVVTAVLSLDATVVLFTPVVVATAAALRLRPRPHVYACTHLANSASLLLPVSNLTNLLVFGSLRMSFVRFGLLMAAPWLAVLAVEYAAVRRCFAPDLGASAATDPDVQPVPVEVPVFALVVVGLSLAGSAGCSLLGTSPAWAVAGGAAVLAVRRLTRGQSTVGRVFWGADPAFVVFVLALGVVVRGVQDNGLGQAMHHVLPASPSLPGLLGAAGVAAVLANLVNNLPATLVLLPLAAAGGPGLVLAMLIGVNVGPNLSFTGSLATLLWRRELRAGGLAPSMREFTRLGALTVPVGLVAGVTALWVGLSWWGG